MTTTKVPRPDGNRDGAENSAAGGLSAAMVPLGRWAHVVDRGDIEVVLLKIDSPLALDLFRISRTHAHVADSFSAVSPVTVTPAGVFG